VLLPVPANKSPLAVVAKVKAGTGPVSEVPAIPLLTVIPVTSPEAPEATQAAPS